MSKHTPGPWEAGWGDGITGHNAGAVVGWIGKYPIRYRGDFGGMSGLLAAVPDCDPNHKANARLIAAAPDLLDSLMTIVNGYSKDGSFLKRDIAAARAAIAKATGESHE